MCYTVSGSVIIGHFLRIEKDDFKVYVLDILTSEQAHKKYGLL